MKDFERYLLSEGRKRKLSESKEEALRTQIRRMNDEISRLEVSKERHNKVILKAKIEKQRIEQLQDSIRVKKKALQAKFNVDESFTDEVNGDELPLGEEVEQCSVGNKNHLASDGTFSSKQNRGSESLHYSCRSDRESKSGKKKSKCGRDKPEKCKDES